MKITVRMFIQHLCNPLHLYCRLKLLLGARAAKKVCGCYEKSIYRPLGLAGSGGR